MRVPRTTSSRVAFAVAVLTLAACGRSGYQYVESDDGHVFAKLPDDWTITSEGIVYPTLLPEGSTSLSMLPGDDTLPWRVEFTSDPAGAIRRDHPVGYLTSQPVDASLRDGLDVSALLPFDRTDAADEFEVTEERQVRSGDLTGVRMVFTSGSGDEELVFHRLVLTDERSSAVYVVQVGCSPTCLEENQDVIDEMMRTFTVEKS